MKTMFKTIASVCVSVGLVLSSGGVFAQSTSEPAKPQPTATAPSVTAPSASQVPVLQPTGSAVPGVGAGPAVAGAGLTLPMLIGLTILVVGVGASASGSSTPAVQHGR
jgi:hypothetical protein